MGLARSIAIGVAAAGFALARAQDASTWLASEPARVFRDRVVELALIYGSSSGIDPQGYKVEARRTSALVEKCARVAITTSLQGVVARRETVDACRRH
jgi:hypothetical protein